MPSKLQREEQTNFRGGLNNVAGTRGVGRNQLRAASNIYIEPDALYRRPGCQRLTTASTAFISITGWVGDPNPSTPDVEVVGITSAGAVHVANISGGAITPPLTFSNVGSITSFLGFTANFARMYDAAGRPALYIGTPTASTPRRLTKWVSQTATLTSIVLPAAPVAADRVFTHNQRLFGIGSLNNAGADYLHYSGLNNGDTLGDTANGGGSVRVDTSGGYIAGCLSIGASLFILHRNGITRFTGWSSDDIQLETQTVTSNSGIGFAKDAMYISLGNVGYALADNGYVYEIVEDGGLRITNPDYLLPNGVSDLWAGVATDRAARKLIWFEYGSLDIHIYNLETNAWSNGTLAIGSQTLSGASNVLTYTDEPPIVFAGSTTCYLYAPSTAHLDDVLADGTSGTEVSATIKPRIYYGRTPTSQKSVRWMYLYTTDQNSAIVPTIAVNGVSYQTDRSNFGTRRFSPATANSIGGVAPSYDIQITWNSNNGVSDPLGIIGCGLDFFEYAERM